MKKLNGIFAEEAKKHQKHRPNRVLVLVLMFFLSWNKGNPMVLVPRMNA